MPEPIELRTEGPFDPDYTRQVASHLAECVRTLNYCSMSGNGGLLYPSDVYDLLGYLYTATQRLPQLLQQLAAFLEARSGTGQLADSGGGDPAMLALDATVGLAVAQVASAHLTGVLQDVQNAISGLYVYVKESPDA